MQQAPLTGLGQPKERPLRPDHIRRSGAGSPPMHRSIITRTPSPAQGECSMPLARGILLSGKEEEPVDVDADEDDEDEQQEDDGEDHQTSGEPDEPDNGPDDEEDEGPPQNSRGGRRCFFWNECRAYAEKGSDGESWAYCARCYSERRRPCPTPRCPRTCSLQADGGRFHPYCGVCRRTCR